MSLLLSTCLLVLPGWCIPCEDAHVEKVDTWAANIRLTLQYFPPSNLSKDLRRALLHDKHPDAFPEVSIENCDDDGSINNVMLLTQGIPRCPRYKELARRLLLWSECGRHPFGQPDLFAPAEILGFEEAPVNIPPPPTNRREIRKWLGDAGEDGILRLLGMRKTVGTDPRPLLPPSRKELLEAAAELHNPNSTLTVGSRARSKHAHRGKEGYFGTMRGSPDAQNKITIDVLNRLFDQAAWINIHTFGGREPLEPVIEIRVVEGYGARWTADWSTSLPNNLRFRGFLEPQMRDGHEKRWRH